MQLHDFPLIRRETARLEQDIIVDADFSDVVHRAGEKDLVDELTTRDNTTTTQV